MFRLLRFFVSVALLAGFIWFGSSVQLGKATLFGHFGRIWRADETQDLVEGAREKAEPVVDRLKRGAEAATKEPAPDAAPEKKRR